MNAPPSSSRTCLGVLLAAGDGVRMRSAIPKALHPVAGRPMVAHALAALRDAGASAIAVVVGPDRDDVAAAARAFAPEAEVFIQSERRGTAHATLAARAAIARGYDDLLVVYADAPLVTAASLKALRQALADGADVAALAFEAANPTGYGRMIERDGRLVAIREEKDATAAERAIRRCNAGPAAIRGAQALALLELVGCDNAQKEFYLTAVAEIAAGRGLKAETRLAAEEEAMGVNDRLQLAAAEAAMQRRLRHKAMVEGATLVAPETIFLSADSVIGRDVTIEVPDTEMTTNAQRLRPFRLRTARPIEEQNRRQAKLAGQMVDDLDRRVPVVIEKIAMGAQHAELQGETALMVRAAALGDHRQVGGRQAPVLRQFVLARIGRHRHPSPGLRGCG